MSPNCRQAAPAAWDISTVLEALRAIARELPAGPWAVTSAGNVRAVLTDELCAPALRLAAAGA
jgi:hypothetical protein